MIKSGLSLPGASDHVNEKVWTNISEGLMRHREETGGGDYEEKWKIVTQLVTLGGDILIVNPSDCPLNIP